MMNVMLTFTKEKEKGLYKRKKKPRQDVEPRTLFDQLRGNRRGDQVYGKKLKTSMGSFRGGVLKLSKQDIRGVHQENKNSSKKRPRSASGKPSGRPNGNKRQRGGN